MRSHVAGALLGLAIALAGAPSDALPPVCLRDAVARLERPIRVPLGCEVIDCCPGCPAGGALDLRVRLDGEALEGAELRVDAPGAAPGRARRIPTGETRLPGVVPARQSGAAPVLTLALRPNERALERWREAASGRAADEALGSVAVEVEQLLGHAPVNVLRLHWDFLVCEKPRASTCDEIVQSGNADGDQSVTLLDARRQAGASACSDDEIRRSAADDPVGNLLAAQGCRSEVAIFSAQNAMELKEGVTNWSDACGDQLPVPLEPILQAPATFFLAVPSGVALGQWGLEADAVAKEDLDNANQIYDENKTGISFHAEMKPVGLLELPRLLAALPQALLQALTTSANPIGFACNVTSGLKNAGFYVPGRLNVYYLPVPGTGMICPDDRNVVFIALGRKPATLAHEFGHSLSLLGTWGHTTGLAGFDSSNVMWGGSPDVRDHFSLGQAFRQNVDTSSTINTNQVRQGPTRSCALTTASSECPPLAEDWVRP